MDDDDEDEKDRKFWMDIYYLGNWFRRIRRRLAYTTPILLARRFRFNSDTMKLVLAFTGNNVHLPGDLRYDFNNSVWRDGRFVGRYAGAHLTLLELMLHSELLTHQSAGVRKRQRLGE